MNGNPPGVVLKSKFVLPNSNEYKEYVDYIDREDVKKEVQLDRASNQLSDFKVFYSYMDYMGDDDKTSSLFTKDMDSLNEEQKVKLKRMFMAAQKNGSPMWQDVISFDNGWLEKQGLYISKTGELDETKLKNVVREAVSEMLRAESMEDSAVWTAAIHYNTDNIHVHVATVEPYPTKEKKWYYDKEKEVWKKQYKARRRQKSLNQMKSKVANRIVDRKEQRNRIDEIIKGAARQKKEEQFDLSSYRKTKKLFLRALIHLPENRRQWHYGYQSINSARPYIDEIVDIYLNTFHKHEMKELEKLLDEEVLVMKELYGEGSRYENYKQTKLDDLRKRMGNAVLAEMREYAKRENSLLYQGKPFKNLLMSRSGLDRAIRNLNFRMRKTYHDYQKDRNLEEFDRMLEGYERY